jgi:hypothetical protein
MTNRRKFLIGVGSLAAGSAAAMGTGAFTSVTADRSVEVAVTGDANAYLALEPVTGAPNNAYVKTSSDGKVSFDLGQTGSSGSGFGDVPGDGYNNDAVARIDNLLEVTNQGTRAVWFHVDVGKLDLDDADLKVELEDDTGSVVAGNVAKSGGWTSPVPDDYELTVGATVTMNLVLDTTEYNGPVPASDDAEIQFIATTAEQL